MQLGHLKPGNISRFAVNERVNFSVQRARYSTKKAQISADGQQVLELCQHISGCLFKSAIFSMHTQAHSGWTCPGRTGIHQGF